MALHIASMMPDRALDESAVGKAITRIAIELAGLRNQPLQKRAPVLDIVFLLPSRVEKADFEGLRLHSYEQGTQMLRIESAVPEKMVTSTHAERFVVAVLLDAIDAAAEFFAERNILFDAFGHQALIEAMAVGPQRAIH